MYCMLLKMTDPKFLTRLVLLVKSLKPSQKTYFKRYIGISGEQYAQYEKLFDSVNFWLKKETQKTSLSKFLEGVDGLNQKQLSRLSTYLFDKILESLRPIPEQYKTSNTILDYIKDIYFLMGREQYEDCLDRIEEAKKLAVIADKPALRFELMHLEKQVISEMGIRRNSDEMAETAQERAQLVAQVDINNSLLAFADCLQVYNFERRFDLYQFEPIWRKLSACTSFTSEQRFSMELMCSQLSKCANMDAALREKLGSINISLLDEMAYLNSIKDSSFIEFLSAEDPRRYINLWDNYLSAALNNDVLEAFESNKSRFERMRDFPKYYRHIVYLYLLYYIKTDKFEAAGAYIQEQKIDIKRLTQLIDSYTPSRAISIAYHCLLVFFVLKKPYVQVRELVDFLLKKSGKYTRIDVYCITRYIEIMVLYSEGILQQHRSPMIYLENLENYLRKYKHWDELHDKLIAGLRVMLKPNGKPAQQKAAMEEIGEYLSRNPGYKPYAILLAWMESCHAQVSLRSVIGKYLH